MANEQVHNALWKILKDGSNSGHVVLSMDRKKSNQICHGIFPPFLGWARNWDTHWLWNKLSNRHGRKLQVKAWLRRRSSFEWTIATFARSTKPTSYKHCSDFGDDYPRCHLYCLGFYMMRVDQCKCVPSGAAWELPKLFPATTVLDFPWLVDLHSRWKGSRVCTNLFANLCSRWKVMALVPRPYFVGVEQILFGVHDIDHSRICISCWQLLAKTHPNKGNQKGALVENGKTLFSRGIKLDRELVQPI